MVPSPLLSFPFFLILQTYKTSASQIGYYRDSILAPSGMTRFQTCHKNKSPLIAESLVAESYWSLVYSPSTAVGSILGIAVSTTINNQAAPKRDWFIALGFSDYVFNLL